MDPITITMISAAVTKLAVEVVKGTAGAAGKDLWNKIKKTLGITSNPSEEDIPQIVNSRLTENPQLGPKIYQLLQESNSTDVQQLVGKIDAEKVVVANRLDVKGDFHMD